MTGTAQVAGRVLREFVRNRRVLLMWGVFPALMLILFGWVGAEEAGGLAPSFTRSAPGILLGAAMFFSCLGGPVSIIVGERERHTMRRLLLSPLGGRAYFGGLVCAHLTIAAGQAAVVYGITYLVGGGFRGPLIPGAVIVLLSAVAYVGVGFFFGARLTSHTEDVNGPVAAFGVPLLVVGGTFFSTELLPPMLKLVGHLDPVFHMNEALKPLASGAAGLGGVWDHVLFLLGFAGLSLVGGVHAYQRMLAREREAS